MSRFRPASFRPAPLRSDPPRSVSWRWGLLALASAATAHADTDPGGITPYAGIQFGGSVVSHSELDFISPLVSANIGTFFLPGIGVEVFAGSVFANGEDGRFEAAVTESYGVALRLQSPSQGGLHGYVVLGYVDFLLEQAPLDVSGGRIEERFGGAHIAIGVMRDLARAPNLSLTAEYRNAYIDEPIQVDGLAVGLKIDFR